MQSRVDVHNLTKSHFHAMNWLNPSQSFKGSKRYQPAFEFLVVTKKTAMMNSIIGDARSILGGDGNCCRPQCVERILNEIAKAINGTFAELMCMLLGFRRYFV